MYHLIPDKTYQNLVNDYRLFTDNYGYWKLPIAVDR